MTPVTAGFAAIALGATLAACATIIWGCAWRGLALDAERKLSRIRLTRSVAISRGNRTRAALKRARAANKQADVTAS